MVASFVLRFISQKRPCYQSISASTQDLSLCHLLSHRCACCAAPRVLSWFKVSLHLTTHEPAPGAGSPATQNALCRAVDVTPLQAEGCSDTAYTCLPQRTPHFKLGSPNEFLTSPSLPGSPRLPEPRVQRWLRGWGTGDRSPSGDRGLLLPSDPHRFSRLLSIQPLLPGILPKLWPRTGKSKAKLRHLWERSGFPGQVFPGRRGRKAAAAAWRGSSRRSGGG